MVGENIQEIDRCCAVDFEKKGKPYIKLFVTMKDGYEYSEMIEQKIKILITTNLMKYSLPKVIECVKELPLTAIGKVDYNKLKEKEQIL